MKSLFSCFVSGTSSSRSKLLDAAKDGDDVATGAVLAAHPELVSTTTLLQRKTVLHLAAENGHAGVMASVLEFMMCQASLDLGKGGVVPHEDAAAQIASLINARDTQGSTALTLSCAQNNSECVRLLLSNGAWREPRDAFGNSAMHYASAKGHLGIMLMLCTEFLDELAAEQLEHARRRRRWTSIPEEGLPVLPNSEPSTPRTAEDSSAVTTRRREPNVPRIVNVQNGSGFTPLHYAVWGKQSGAVQVLLQHGADLLLRNGRPGADASIPCPGGSTPLHLAAMRGHVEISRLLLKTFYERVLEPMTLNAGPDAEALARSIQQVDPRTQTNSAGLMPYKVAQRMGFLALSTMLRPQIPLARLFNEEEHRTRFYGPPALKLLAAEALNRKLLAALAVVVAAAPPPVSKSNPGAAPPAATGEAAGAGGNGVSHTAVAASAPVGAGQPTEASAFSAPVMGALDISQSSTTSPPAATEPLPMYQSAPQLTAPVEVVPLPSAAISAPIPLAEAGGSGQDTGAGGAGLRMGSPGPHARMAMTPQASMASTGGAAYLPVVNEGDEDEGGPGSMPVVPPAASLGPALGNTSASAAGLTPPGPGEAGVKPAPQVSPFASASGGEWTATPSPPPPAVTTPGPAVLDSAAPAALPNFGASSAVPPVLGITGRSFSLGIPGSVSAPGCPPSEAQGAGVAGTLPVAAGAPPPARVTYSGAGSSTSTAVGGGLRGNGPLVAVAGSTGALRTQTAGGALQGTARLNRMMSTPAALRQERLTGGGANPHPGLPPHVLMLQRGNSIMLLGAAPPTAMPPPAGAQAPYLVLDSLQHVVEDTASVMPRGSRMGSCIPHLAGVPVNPEGAEEDEEALVMAATTSVSPGNGATGEMSVGGSLRASLDGVVPTRSGSPLRGPRAGSPPRRGSLGGNSAHMGSTGGAGGGTGGAALQVVRSMARSLSGLRRTMSGSGTLHTVSTHAQPGADVSVHARLAGGDAVPSLASSSAAAPGGGGGGQDPVFPTPVTPADAPTGASPVMLPAITSAAAAAVLGLAGGSDDDADECGVCLEYKAVVLIQPCHHTICGACAHKMCTINAQRSPCCAFCRALIADFTPNPALMPRV